MKRLISFSTLLFTFALLLTSNLAAASLIQEAVEIPYQINNSDRIVIGTVSEIHTYDTYTVNTITVKEWLYNSLPAKTIKVTNKIGTNLWVEDEAEFTRHETVLLMLKDSDLNKLLFTVSVGFPGKRPVSDRDAVIEELKAQGKWKGEDQTENTTNDTGIAANTGTLREQEEKSNFSSGSKTPESKSTPIVSPFWVIAVLLGAAKYLGKKK